MKVKATLKKTNSKELNSKIDCFKALNDSPEISEQTKIKIKEYANLKKL
jgi:LacI family transcriptional regulator